MGKDVLSRMIAFVGQIISLLGNIPEIDKYVLQAIDFLATFRRIEDSNLKLSIIRSFQICLLKRATTGDQVWIDQNWRNWLEECRFRDCPNLSLAAAEICEL